MNNLVNISSNGAAITMTSLELVDFINEHRAMDEAVLRHDSFMDKVPKVLGDNAPKFLGTQIYGNNNTRAIYTFPKREACLMAMSYSYELQAKVFDRMTALETKHTMATPAALSRIEILRLAMESEEARIKAESERDLAVATKAEIGSRREATAMATASAAIRKVNRLTEQLGHNIRHATIIAVEKAAGRKFGSQDWRPLRDFCKSKGLQAEKVTDTRYGEVKAWPAEAWSAVYGIDLGSLFPNAGLQ